jgi:hypothetical protein
MRVDWAEFSIKWLLLSLQHTVCGVVLRLPAAGTALDCSHCSSLIHTLPRKPIHACKFFFSTPSARITWPPCFFRNTPPRISDKPILPWPRFARWLAAAARSRTAPPSTSQRKSIFLLFLFIIIVFLIFVCISFSLLYFFDFFIWIFEHCVK